MATRLQELQGQRDFRIEWLGKLDADAARSNDGWPLDPAEPGILRQLLVRDGVYCSEMHDVHEFDLLRCLFYPWTPSSGAAATATVVRRELTEIEAVILMLEKKERA